MADTSANNKRIAKNTIMLYFRMMLMMLVALYTSRVVLSTLGVEDYGTYNVVGGFVTIFSFLNGAMSGGTLRFLTFSLGKGDEDELNKTFSTCFLTHTSIAALILILAESIGLWFVLTQLTIPEGRMTAVMWVYQCSIISSILMVMTLPFSTVIIAHEKMSAFAYLSILEAFLKLGIVYLLLLGDMDRMILYSILSLMVSMIMRVISIVYCFKKFPETHYISIWDKPLFKKILSFSGWNLWGNISAVLMTHGVNIVLNIFFGPTVNAARALAVQVQGAVQQFSQNFQTALNPQITKQYAANNLDQMHMLVFRSAKFTFLLLLCLSLPILFETPLILSLWLEETPDYTVAFVRLMICITIIDAVANSLVTAANATGDIKKYQMVVGGILLLIVPVSYITLKISANPILVYVVHICIAICAFAARLYLVRPMIRMTTSKYVKNVFSPILTVGACSLICTLGISSLLPDTTIGSIVNIAQSVIISLIISFSLGLTSNEKAFVLSKLKVLKGKL